MGSATIVQKGTPAMGRLGLILVVIALSSPLALGESVAPKLDAEGIQALSLPDVRIDSVAHDESGGFYDIDGFIGGTIGFEVLLPDEWNGRFAMGGGGGFVGSVQYATRGDVRRGYVTAGTDTGHQHVGLDAPWAYGDMLAQVNFGHLAVHRTAEVAKAFIRAVYGQDAEYSYFLGCSRGGGQAMIASQGYPEDFDGIVAGAPAFDWTGIAAVFIHTAQTLYPDPNVRDETFISQELLNKVYDSFMAQCDAADGVEDGIVADPRDVEFDVSKVPGITEKQAEAIQSIYDGVSNDDGLIYPGFSPGAEKYPSGWFAWISGPVPGLVEELNFPNATFGFGTEVAKNFIFHDKDWNYSTQSFDTWEEDSFVAGTILNGTNPDITPFKERGGKLVLWHGWADPALPPLATIDYYEEMLALDPDAADYARLFLLSGCLHCGGGPGPSSVNWLEVIVDWVENGMAPDKIVASKGRGSGAEPLTRPLYPYPLEAEYDGKGNPDSAESFLPMKPID